MKSLFPWPNSTSQPRRTITAASLSILLFSAETQPTLARQSGPPVDTVRVELPGVRVEATRGIFETGRAPASVAQLERQELARRTEPAATLESVLTPLPGLWLADRGHLALGERVVVRGLGSRAGFGVRSVAVLLDGVLLTMPDGQAVLDPVEPAMLERAELVRGPASRFWGNAAGGVLHLSTAQAAEGSHVGLRTSAGSFGQRQLLADASFANSRHRTTAYVSYLDQDSYRQHAEGSMSRFGVRSTVPVGSSRVLQIAVHASDLDTQGPGSLTLDQWSDDPAAADPRYVATSSGKRARQVQASVGLMSSLGGGTLSTSLFVVDRSLDNPLPFAWIGVERLAGGLRADWVLDRDDLSLGIGADWRHQRDERLNTNNADGARGADVGLDQREEVSGAGASLLLSHRLRGSLTASGGLRVDRLSVRMSDHLLSNGDQSGSEDFLAASPSASLAVNTSIADWFVSYTTAFEIPTTTELVNNPAGLGGFNQALDPQRVSGFEVGGRASGDVPNGARWAADVAVYAQRLTNFLTPYQLDEFPGRTFYDNVGRVDYRGLEASVQSWIRPWLDVVGTAALHRYEFLSGSLAGQVVPGVPARYGTVEVSASGQALRATARVRLAGPQYADDANDTRLDGFSVVDLRLGGRFAFANGADIAPFAEISNLFDTDYLASVVVNARGGRFYEGAPGRALRVGLSLRF